MEKYADFRQFPKFGATFADNAAEVYRELAEARPQGAGKHGTDFVGDAK